MALCLWHCISLAAALLCTEGRITMGCHRKLQLYKCDHSFGNARLPPPAAHSSTVDAAFGGESCKAESDRCGRSPGCLFEMAGDCPRSHTAWLGSRESWKKINSLSVGGVDLFQGLAFRLNWQRHN